MTEKWISLNPYKDYSLYQIKDGGVVWSDQGGWLDCVFDNEETAKIFIDLQDKFTINFYNVITEVQKIANETNNGYVTIDIINQFEKKK